MPNNDQINADTPANAIPTLNISKEIKAPKKSTFKNLMYVFLLAIGAIIFVIMPPSDFPRGGTITITPGEGLKEISTELAQSGYIKSSFIFMNFVIIFGGEKHLSQGDYYFEQPATVIAIAHQIANAEHHLEQIKITIPEGRTVSEISAIFKGKLSSFDSDLFLKQAAQYEGFLFPETYFVYPRTDAITILNEMRDMYNKEAKPIIRKENKIGKSERDIVIMASLIEREARGTDDREVISGILWNRLERQIPLQVDATVAYAKGIPENALKKADMGFESPYNTYLFRGLTPGPISNPGILALRAAMNPASTPYLYYLHDKHGNIHYAKTYVEHQANINKFLR
jgi:UPF0755 protein